MDLSDHGSKTCDSTGSLAPLRTIHVQSASASTRCSPMASSPGGTVIQPLSSRFHIGHKSKDPTKGGGKKGKEKKASRSSGSSASPAQSDSITLNE